MRATTWLLVSEHPAVLLWLLVPTLIVASLVARFIRGGRHPLALAVSHVVLALLAAFALLTIMALVDPDIVFLHNFEGISRLLIRLAVAGNFLSLCAILWQRRSSPADGRGLT
jgi:hypothetical protein